MCAVYPVFHVGCSSLRSRTPYQSGPSLLHCQSKSTVKPSTRSPKFLIPRLTGTVDPATYYTLSAGLVMKVLMKNVMGPCNRDCDQLSFGLPCQTQTLGSLSHFSLFFDSLHGLFLSQVSHSLVMFALGCFAEIPYVLEPELPVVSSNLV
jgi:hypothetical protein